LLANCRKHLLARALLGFAVLEFSILSAFSCPFRTKTRPKKKTRISAILAPSRRYSIRSDIPACRFPGYGVSRVLTVVKPSRVVENLPPPFAEQGRIDHNDTFVSIFFDGHRAPPCEGTTVVPVLPSLEVSIQFCRKNLFSMRLCERLRPATVMSRPSLPSANA